jgi:hypothetical protein
MWFPMKRVSFGVILFFVALICTVPVSAVYVACTNGTAATIAVNWTFTGAPGTMALVSNVGTSSNALLDFTIPQGQSGAVGGDTSQFLFINGTRAMTGDLNMNGLKIAGLVSGATGGYAVNKSYVDSLVSGLGAPDLSSFIFKNGTRAFEGDISHGGYKITSLVTGATGDTATNKSYVDSTNSSMKTYVDSRSAPDLSPFVFTNGSRPMAGNFNVSNYNIVNVNTGTTGSNAANKTYVDNAVSGVGTPDLSPYLFQNGTRALTGNLNASNNQIINVNTGVTGSNAANKTYVDNAISGVGTPDLTPYLFINGTRSMTGKLQMGTYNVTGVGNPVGAQDAATKSYTDSVNTSMKNYVDSAVGGIGSPDLTPFLFINGTRAMTGDLNMNTKMISGLVSGVTGGYAVNKSYVDAAVSGVGSPDLTPFLFINGTRAMTGKLQMGTYNISNTGNPVAAQDVSTKAYSDSLNSSMKTYVDNSVAGFGAPDLSPFLFINGTRAMSGKLQMGGFNISNLLNPVAAQDASTKAYSDSLNSSMKTYVDNSVAGVGAPDLTPFIFQNGTRPMTGNFNSSNYQIINVNTGTTGGNAVNKTYVDNAISGVGAPDLSPYLFVNGTRAMTGNLNASGNQITKLVTGATGDTAVNRTYVDSGLPYVAGSNSSLVLTNNGSYLRNPVYGYLTVMAGSAIIPTTSPSGMNQAEYGANNYIYTEFTDGGSENTQFLVDMPGDWNSSDATYGKLTYNFLWTTTGGGAGQTVKFDIAGKIIADDGALNTAVASVGTATTTWVAANDLQVSGDTTPAVVTSTGTGGRTCIFKVTRDSGTDTLGATARLVGVRIKYIRTLA